MADAEPTATPSGEESPPVRVNPFKKFIDQSIVGFPSEAKADATGALIGDETHTWVQYLDDESGYLYWYNTATGEARWVTDGQEQEQSAGAADQPIATTAIEQPELNPLIISSAWEKYYDDDGNPYFYNKETGASEWEIPAGEVFVDSFLPADQEHIGQVHDTFDGAWMGEETSAKHEDSLQEGSRILKTASSFRSIKSARSVGLHSPSKSSNRLASKASFSSMANLETSLGSSRDLKHAVSFSNREMKQTMSFSSGKAPQVDNSRKPASPIKRKSKSGFQMLKEGATVMREATDENGEVWLEFQSADEGPIFYAVKDSVNGQWSKPLVFNIMDASQLPKRAPVGDYESSMSEASVGEIVDYFAAEHSISSPSHAEGKTTRFADTDLVFYQNETASPSVGSVVALEADEGSVVLAAQSDAILPVLSPKEAASNKNIEVEVRVEAKPEAVVKAVVALEVLSSPGTESPRLSAASPSPVRGTAVDLDSTLDRHSDISLAKSSLSSVPATPVKGVSAQPAPLSLAVPSSASSAPTSFTASPSPATAPVISPAVGTAPVAVSSGPVVATATVPADGSVPTAIQLHIQSIQAEAMLELERLKDRMDVAKKDFQDTKDPVVALLTKEQAAPKAEPVIVSVPVTSVAASPARSTGSAKPTLFLSRPSPKEDSKPVDNNGRIDESEVDWIELYARSHVVQRTGHWIVLQDTSNNQRFFRNQDTGKFQFIKPDEIGDIKEASPYPLLKSLTNSTKLGLKPSDGAKTPGGTQAAPANAMGYTSPAMPSLVPPAQPSGSDRSSPSKSSLKPTITPLSSGKDNKGETRSSFLTMVNIAEDEQASQQPSLEPGVDVSKELAFVEKAAASEFHAFLQRDYQNQDVESQALLKRLQALAFERQADPFRNTANMRGRATKIQTLASMDKDEIKKLHSRARHIIEKCCAILEQIEVSPTEHLINEQHLLKAAMQQRNVLIPPLCARHDGPVHDFLPTALCFPCYKPMQDYWRDRNDGQMVNEHWVMFTNDSGDAWQQSAEGNGKRWYYHTVTGMVQRGEPFDVLMKRIKVALKREQWSDYDVRTSIDQRIMEQRGIELLVDDHGGYLYYCPLRKAYSSNGVFDKLQSLNTLQTTKKAPAHAWNSSHNAKVSSLTSKQNLNVWSSFQFSSTLIDPASSASEGQVLLPKSLDQYRTAFLKQSQLTKGAKAGKDDIGTEWHLNLLEEAFSVARADLMPSTSMSPADQTSTVRFENTMEAETELLMLKFEENFDLETYAKYHVLILNIASDPDNPIPLLELMEFLLLQGLGKIALAVFKHAMDTMKLSAPFGCNPYEMAMGHVFSQKMALKYFNYFEKFNNVMVIAQRFHESPFILANVASYFYKMRRLEFAELLFIGTLIREPNHEFALLQYAHLLIEKGDYRTAQRQLQRCSEISGESYYGNMARIEINWLQELQKGQEEHILLCYKNCLSNTRRDKPQSCALHGIGAYYQFSQDGKLNPEAMDYYKRSLQVDSDNAQTSFLWAAASAVFQHQFLTVAAPVVLPAVVVKGGEGKISPIPTSNGRPGSAQHGTGRKDVTKASNGAINGMRTIRSATATRRPLTLSFEDSPSPAPVEMIGKNYSANGCLSMIEIDAHYRKGLVLMPDAPYRWIVLLSYADFILCGLKDTHRAQQYYEEGVKLCFSSTLWPIVALGHFYQYTLNDYKATSHLYLRAMRSRHPQETVSSLERFRAFHAPASAQGSLDHASDHGPSPAPDDVDSMECVALYTAVAYLLWDMDNTSVAKLYATAALNLCPTYGPACRCISALLFFEGERRLCFRYINVALDHCDAGNLMNVYTMRSAGMMKAVRHQYDDAIKQLDRSLIVAPNCALSHKMIGIMQFMYKQQTEKALLCLQKSFQLSQSEDMEALRLKAQMFMDQRQFKEARIYLLEALRIVPYDAISFANLAICVFFLKLDKQPSSQFSMKHNYAQQYREAPLSEEQLESLAHSKDPYELFEAALAQQPRDKTASEDGLAEHQVSILSISDPDQQVMTQLPPGVFPSQSISGQAKDNASLYNASASSSVLVLAYITFLYGCFELSRVAEDSLSRAKLLFATAAGYLGANPEGCLFPLIMYQLGAISEAEGDLYNAERQYEQSLQHNDLHPLTLLRLIVNIEDSLFAVKTRLRKIKEPFMGKSSKKKRKKQKKGNNTKLNPADSTFSDFEGQRERLKQQDDQYAQFAPLMQPLQGQGDGEDDDEPLPMHNTEASLLLKKMMLHQRIQETAMIKKFSYQKILKDIPKAAVMTKISYVYLDTDWMQRSLYSFSKCEDWTHMLKQLEA